MVCCSGAVECAPVYKRNRQPMNPVGVLALTIALLLMVACSERTEVPIAPPTPDIEATVQAAVAAAAAAIPTATPTPTPDLDATVAAGIAATLAAIPTATPTATPTPTPTATPTSTPAPTPEPAATPALVPTATPTPATSPPVLLSDMVRQARPAVVRIETASGSGTGVIFETRGQTGYVITNYHVVEGAARVDVHVNDESIFNGSVRGVDPVRDLAVVTICCGRFHTLPFGDASRLEPGGEVVAIGYALGLSGEASITRGIVSAIRHDSRYLRDVIQTDAAINPGNSGGPMLSMSGEILGINTFKISEARVEGLGFAISETTVQGRIAALRSGSPGPMPFPTRQSTPPPQGSDGFGPTSGELRHNPADNLITTEYADVSIANMVVEATFVNPYSAASNPWDYGFILRAGSSSSHIQVFVDSRGRWNLIARDGTSSGHRAVGTLRRFNTRPKRTEPPASCRHQGTRLAIRQRRVCHNTRFVVRIPRGRCRRDNRCV